MSLTRSLALDLFSQRGGATPGLVTSYDKSRWHHDVALHNITWVQDYEAGLWLPVFNGINAYMDRAHANTEALGITNDLNRGYTIMGWFNWVDTTDPRIIIGRYEVDVGGWELYVSGWGGVYSLNQRHHHAGTIVDTHPRSGSYSVDWTPGVTSFFTVVYQGNGTDCLHYRNAVPLAVVSSTGGVLDFEATTQDLVGGTRFTKDTDWYEGTMGLLKFYPYIWTHGQICQRYEAVKYLAGIAR